MVYIKQNSVYSLFPFFTPETSRKNLTKLNLVKKYTFERPKAIPVTKVVHTFQGIDQVFKNYHIYKETCGPDMQMLTENYGLVFSLSLVLVLY